MTPKQKQAYLREFSAMVHGDDHGSFCACWQCVGRLHVWVLRTQARRIENELAAAMLGHN